MHVQRCSSEVLILSEITTGPGKRNPRPQLE